MADKIPKGWQLVKLSDVADKINDKIELSERGKFKRYVAGEHIDGREIRITKSAPIEGNEEVIGSAFHMRFKPGHVLYVTRRAYLRKAGIVDFEGICSNVSFILEAKKDKLLQTLLPYILQTEDFVNHAISNSHGSTNPFLNWKDIANYEFILPSIEDQKKINDILWKIEDCISHAKIIYDRRTFIRRIVLKNLLIDNKKNVLSFGKLSDIAEITMGQSPPSSSYNTKGIGIPFFQGKGDFGEKYPIGKVYTDNPTKIAKKGSILFTVRAPVGELNWCNVECCIGRGLASINSKENSRIEYLYYVLERLKNRFEEMSQGTTFTAINRDEIEKFAIPIISLKEQDRINKILSSADKGVQSAKEYISSLKYLRQKLMNELLLGKLRLE